MPSSSATTNTTMRPPTSIAAAAAATASASQPLTLIVATTPITHPTNPSRTRLGIGYNGTLPWPRIKSDMSFFARVTTRPPATSTNANANASTDVNVINAVIMGRKTYDSLPERFRPLPRRCNVVITRDESGDVERRVVAEWRAARRREKEKEEREKGNLGDGCEREMVEEEGEEKPDVLVAGSVEEAVRELKGRYLPRGSGAEGRKLGGIYVIGGGQIYESTLRLGEGGMSGHKIRLVVTDVRRRQVSGAGSTGPGDAAASSEYDPSKEVNGFECDTFFPLDQDDLERSSEWRKAEPSEVTQWVGEEVTGEWKWEGNIAIRMCGYEKVPSAA